VGFPAQLPARGAVEVKGAHENAGEVVRGEQVGRYLRRYGQVLVTNYREFENSFGQSSTAARAVRWHGDDVK